jgi:hypothetical protein
MMDSKLQIVDEFKRPLSISPAGVEKILLPKSFTTPANPNNCFIDIQLVSDSQILAQSSFFYVPDKYFNFEKPEIETKTEKIDALNWKLTLSSKNLVKDVHIDLPFDADLSDDYFDLINQPVTIDIKTVSAADEISSQMKLNSVNSIVAEG